jgi:23S rRNA-/tRNA-specific pseudouridylate synthase
MTRLLLPVPHQSTKLIDLLANQLRPESSSDDDTVGLVRAAELLAIGAVWRGNQRLREPDWIVTSDCWVAWPRLPVVAYHLAVNQIFFEDDHLLVVWKPSGLNTCPSVYSDQDCLSHGVQMYLDAAGLTYQVNTINRLDRATQGLVLFAKHKAAEVALHRSFMNRQISKRYLALTPTGIETLDRYRICDQLEWRGRTQTAETWIRRVQPPIRDTKVLPMNYFLVWPQTGRTHQIRKHFARYVVPIAGDSLYGAASDSKLQLYCVGYRLRHPITGLNLRVSALRVALIQATGF